MKLLIIGATGLVGRQVLSKALEHPSVEQVIAPVRRPISGHKKLEAPIVDYENFTFPWGDIDAVICTLGTTMKIAGSKDAFYRIDHDYPLMIAKLALQNGCNTYILNSATGANTRSKIFYNQVKGKLEQDLLALNFRSLTFVQPGLIGGKRAEFRFGECMLAWGLKVLAPVLPKAWRINPVENIVNALLEAAIEAKSGCHVVKAQELTR